MITVALLMVAASVALGIATWWRVPAGSVAIGAGLAVSALPLPLDLALTQEGLLLAATFLVFAVGAEVDHRHVQRYGAVAVAVAVAELIGLGVVVVPLAWWFGVDLLSAVLLTLALGSSSTVGVVELLRRRERFFEPVGRLVLGVVLVQDLLIVVALGLMVSWSGPGGWPLALAGLLGLGLGVLVTRNWLGRLVLVRLQLDEEERLLFVLALLFVFMALASAAGLPVVAGAFFAGAALSGFPVGATVRAYLASFSDFFSLLFYVSLGALVTLPGPGLFAAELAMVAGVLLIRPLLLLPLVRRAGLPLRASVEAVTLLGQSGELALIVGIVGVMQGILQGELVGVIVVVAVVTMALAPLLSSDRMTWGLTRRAPSPAPVLKEPPRGHVVLIGVGEGGRALLSELPQSVRQELVVIDDDPAVVAELGRQGIRGVRGDGADPAVLVAAGARQARAVISTMRRMADNARLLRHLPDVPVMVRVSWSEQAERVRALGGRPVVEAELAEGVFLEWYEGWR